jgi:hypothetical protein
MWPVLPVGTIRPVVDGRLRDEDGWDAAGLMAPDHPSTMQRSEVTRIVEVRFGWGPEHLYLLLIPRDPNDLEGLELELRVTPTGEEHEPVCRMVLAEGGLLEVSCGRQEQLAGTATGAWREVAEVALPLVVPAQPGRDRLGLVLRVGRQGMTEHVFHSAGLTPVGEGET